MRPITLKPQFRFALRLVVAGALLTLIVARLDGVSLTVRGGPGAAAAVLLGACLLLMSQAVAALRWKILLGIPGVPWRYLARLYVIASFFSLMLPTAVGGDAVRAVAAARSAGRPGMVAASVVLDRALGVAALLAWAVVGLVLAGGVPPALHGGVEWLLTPARAATSAVAIAAAAAIAFVLLLRSRRGRIVIADAGAVLGALTVPRLAAGFALALVVQAMMIALWVVLARGLAFDITLAALLVGVPLVAVGTMLPVTVGGLGVREGLWLLLLRESGHLPADVLAFSLSYFAVSLVVGIAGLVLFVVRGTGLLQSAPRESSGSHQQ